MGFGEYSTDLGIEEAAGGGVGIVYGMICVAVTQGAQLHKEWKLKLGLLCMQELARTGDEDGGARPTTGK